MGIGNILLLAQVTTYVLSFILSFFIFIPICLCKTNFGGNCILFARGTWTAVPSEEDVHLKVEWGSTGPCNFAAFVGVIVMLMSLFYIVWYSILLFKEADSSWLDTFLSTGFNFVLTIFTFAASLMISLGFRDWCSVVTDQKGHFQSCEDADYVPFGESSGINTVHFYVEYQMAQFGSWSIWICTLTLFLFSIIKLVRYHSQEAFFTSMSRERQRLIQRVQNQSLYSASVPT